MKSVTEIGFKVSSLIPLAFLTSFGLFVLRAYIQLGTLPRPYVPDPKDLGFSSHMWAVYILFLITLLSPFLVGGSWYDVRKYKIKNAKLFLWTYLTSLLVTFLFVAFDPGRFLDWFMD